MVHVWAVALLLLAGCASAQRATDFYTTDAAPGPAALGPRANELEALLRQACAERLHRVVVPDARLARVAAWVAERNAAADPPQMPRRIAVTTREGVPFPTPAIVELRYTPGIDLARLQEALFRNVAEVGGSTPLARYGLAVREGAEMHYAVAVLTAAEVSFTPVPRHASAGDALELRGSLAEPLRRPRIAVTMPDGQTQNLTGQGRLFDFSVPLTTSGTYAVEIIGDGVLGPSVLANFPVYVDTPEPALPSERPVQQVTTSAETEAELLALINAERVRAGVRPLTPWPALATVARGHSQDMVEHKFIAHVSPTMGTTEERLRRAGIPFTQFGENVGMAGTTAEVHAGLMASPGHRQAIVNPAYTHIGIGVALQLQDSTYVPVVTEDFVAVPSAPSASGSTGSSP
jgi:uncharacterized protein YkwD